MYRAKRIGNGRYLYRGYEIQRYPSEGLLPGSKYIWEASDEYGCGFAHSSTLGYCKQQIDEELAKVEEAQK